MEPVTAHNDVLVLALVDLGRIQSLGSAEGLQQLLAVLDVLILELMPEELIDLILGGSALCDGEPVVTGARGIRTGQHLDPVAVLDLVVNWYKLTINLSTNHSVTYC